MTDLGASAKLRAAFELSPTILSVSDLEEGRLLEVNDAFLRITGYTREEVIGRRIPELGFWVDPEERERGLGILRSGGAVRDIEARFRTKAGDEVYAIANADLVVMDGRPCVITALMDITARVRAERALRQSELLFAQFFHANPLPMSIVRLRDGRHVDVNDAAIRHSGCSREELLDRTKPELGIGLTPADRERMFELLHRDGRVRDFEARFRTRHGERHLLVNSEVIMYAGEPAVLIVSLDITERAQAAQAKDEFLAMLSHELRNPLSTITTTLGVLDRRVGDDTLQPLIAIITRQAGQLTRLVDDLLDVARVTSGKIELRSEFVDLHALAVHCVDALAEPARLRRHDVAVHGESLHVHGDPARLEQVIRNLLDNAIKYTPMGGEIRVATRLDGADAVLTVRDSGEGIPAELLGTVFDLFVQGTQALDRPRGGLGLGLSLVKRLVTLHNGSVSAWSAGPGRGSEFTVRLPAIPPADVADATPVRSTAPALPVPRRRVLVVEDNDDARESLQLLLEVAGHDVESAADARAALAKLPTFQPDVALIDIGLPDVDGYALAQKIREQTGPALRLIALTGYGQSEDRHKALAAGFDLHVTKPVDPDRLERLLAD
jgi:two-component system CheB/CheR fusion protein